jgi:hypothetical protein
VNGLPSRSADMQVLAGNQKNTPVVSYKLLVERESSHF